MPDICIGLPEPSFQILWRKRDGLQHQYREKTLSNDSFHEAMYTVPRSQLIGPGEKIGPERHESHAQFIRVDAGSGVAILNGKRHLLKDGMAVVIPAGIEHNAINT